MKAKEKKTRALLERLRTDLWDAGRLDVIPDLYEANCVVRVDNQTVRGVRALSEFDAALAMAFPDLAYEWDDIQVVPEGSSAVLRWHGEGSHLGTFLGIPQTGRPVSFWGITMYRIEDSMIAESWTVSTLPQVVETLRKASTEPS